MDRKTRGVSDGMASDTSRAGNAPGGGKTSGGGQTKTTTRMTLNEYLKTVDDRISEHYTSIQGTMEGLSELREELDSLKHTVASQEDSIGELEVDIDTLASMKSRQDLEIGRLWNEIKKIKSFLADGKGTDGSPVQQMMAKFDEKRTTLKCFVKGESPQAVQLSPEEVQTLRRLDAEVNEGFDTMENILAKYTDTERQIRDIKASAATARSTKTDGKAKSPTVYTPLKRKRSSDDYGILESVTVVGDEVTDEQDSSDVALPTKPPPYTPNLTEYMAVDEADFDSLCFSPKMYGKAQMHKMVHHPVGRRVQPPEERPYEWERKAVVEETKGIRFVVEEQPKVSDYARVEPSSVDQSFGPPPFVPNLSPLMALDDVDFDDMFFMPKQYRTALKQKERVPTPRGGRVGRQEDRSYQSESSATDDEDVDVKPERYGIPAQYGKKVRADRTSERIMVGGPRDSSYQTRSTMREPRTTSTGLYQMEMSTVGEEFEYDTSQDDEEEEPWTPPHYTQALPYAPNLTELMTTNEEDFDDMRFTPYIYGRAQKQMQHPSLKRADIPSDRYRVVDAGDDFKPTYKGPSPRKRPMTETYMKMKDDKTKERYSQKYLQELRDFSAVIVTYVTTNAQLQYVNELHSQKTVSYQRHDKKGGKVEQKAKDERMQYAEYPRGRKDVPQTAVTTSTQPPPFTPDMDELLLQYDDTGDVFVTPGMIKKATKQYKPGKDIGISVGGKMAEKTSAKHAVASGYKYDVDEDSTMVDEFSDSKYTRARQGKEAMKLSTADKVYEGENRADVRKGKAVDDSVDTEVKQSKRESRKTVRQQIDTDRAQDEPAASDVARKREWVEDASMPWQFRPADEPPPFVPDMDALIQPDDFDDVPPTANMYRKVTKSYKSKKELPKDKTTVEKSRPDIKYNAGPITISGREKEITKFTTVSKTYSDDQKTEEEQIIKPPPHTPDLTQFMGDDDINYDDMFFTPNLFFKALKQEKPFKEKKTLKQKGDGGKKFDLSDSKVADRTLDKVKEKYVDSEVTTHIRWVEDPSIPWHFIAKPTDDGKEREVDYPHDKRAGISEHEGKKTVGYRFDAERAKEEHPVSEVTTQKKWVEDASMPWEFRPADEPPPFVPDMDALIQPDDFDDVPPTANMYRKVTKSYKSKKGTPKDKAIVEKPRPDISNKAPITISGREDKVMKFSTASHTYADDQGTEEQKIKPPPHTPDLTQFIGGDDIDYDDMFFTPNLFFKALKQEKPFKETKTLKPKGDRGKKFGLSGIQEADHSLDKVKGKPSDSEVKTQISWVEDPSTPWHFVARGKPADVGKERGVDYSHDKGADISKHDEGKKIVGYRFDADREKEEHTVSEVTTQKKWVEDASMPWEFRPAVEPPPFVPDMDALIRPDDLDDVQPTANMYRKVTKSYESKKDIPKPTTKSYFGDKSGVSTTYDAKAQYTIGYGNEVKRTTTTGTDRMSDDASSEETFTDKLLFSAQPGKFKHVDPPRVSHGQGSKKSTFQPPPFVPDLSEMVHSDDTDEILFTPKMFRKVSKKYQMTGDRDTRKDPIYEYEYYYSDESVSDHEDVSLYPEEPSVIKTSREVAQTSQFPYTDYTDIKDISMLRHVAKIIVANAITSAQLQYISSVDNVNDENKYYGQYTDDTHFTPQIFSRGTKGYQPATIKAAPKFAWGSETSDSEEESFSGEDEDYYYNDEYDWNKRYMAEKELRDTRAKAATIDLKPMKDVTFTEAEEQRRYRLMKAVPEQEPFQPPPFLPNMDELIQQHDDFDDLAIKPNMYSKVTKQYDTYIRKREKQSVTTTDHDDDSSPVGQRLIKTEEKAEDYLPAPLKLSGIKSVKREIKESKDKAITRDETFSGDMKGETSSYRGKLPVCEASVGPPPYAPNLRELMLDDSHEYTIFSPKMFEHVSKHYGVGPDRGQWIDRSWSWGISDDDIHTGGYQLNSSGDSDVNDFSEEDTDSDIFHEDYDEPQDEFHPALVMTRETSEESSDDEYFSALCLPEDHMAKKAGVPKTYGKVSRSKPKKDKIYLDTGERYYRENFQKETAENVSVVREYCRVYVAHVISGAVLQYANEKLGGKVSKDRSSTKYDGDTYGLINEYKKKGKDFTAPPPHVPDMSELVLQAGDSDEVFITPKMISKVTKTYKRVDGAGKMSSRGTDVYDKFDQADATPLKYRKVMKKVSFVDDIMGTETPVTFEQAGVSHEEREFESYFRPPPYAPDLNDVLQTDYHTDMTFSPKMYGRVSKQYATKHQDDSGSRQYRYSRDGRTAGKRVKEEKSRTTKYYRAYLKDEYYDSSESDQYEDEDEEEFFSAVSLFDKPSQESTEDEFFSAMSLTDDFGTADDKFDVDTYVRSMDKRSINKQVTTSEDYVVTLSKVVVQNVMAGAIIKYTRELRDGGKKTVTPTVKTVQKRVETAKDRQRFSLNANWNNSAIVTRDTGRSRLQSKQGEREPVCPPPFAPNVDELVDQGTTDDIYYRPKLFGHVTETNIPFSKKDLDVLTQKRTDAGRRYDRVASGVNEATQIQPFSQRKTNIPFSKKDLDVLAQKRTDAGRRYDRVARGVDWTTQTQPKFKVTPRVMRDQSGKIVDGYYDALMVQFCKIYAVNIITSAQLQYAAEITQALEDSELARMNEKAKRETAYFVKDKIQYYESQATTSDKVIEDDYKYQKKTDIVAERVPQPKRTEDKSVNTAQQWELAEDRAAHEKEPDRRDATTQTKVRSVGPRNRGLVHQQFGKQKQDHGKRGQDLATKKKKKKAAKKEKSKQGFILFSLGSKKTDTRKKLQKIEDNIKVYEKMLKRERKLHAIALAQSKSSEGTDKAEEGEKLVKKTEENIKMYENLLKKEKAALEKLLKRDSAERGNKRKLESAEKRASPAGRDSSRQQATGSSEGRKKARGGDSSRI